jgi:hypothetical protein
MFCHRTVIAYILFKLVLEKLQPREDCGKPAQWLDMTADIEMLKLLHKFCVTFSSDMAHKKVWVSGYLQEPSLYSEVCNKICICI